VHEVLRLECQIALKNKNNSRVTEAFNFSCSVDVRDYEFVSLADI
jgi:hypothetical protein